ncbi:hypothetical protein [Streptomyces sp. NPDC047046]|uniref:hypothetical protein n=1 Tax=Streptomyces sp. NPDC047046 TaxID=3155378 RepID=UPI0033DE8E12
MAENQIHDALLVRTGWEGMDDPPGAMFATGISRDGGVNWQDVREDALAEHDALT